MNPSGPEIRGAIQVLLEGRPQALVRLPMLTGSMAWAILPGDVLLVRTVRGNRVHLGDVVVFLRDGSLVAHRILGVFRLGRHSLLLEKGDQNRTGTRLNQSSVVGLVVGVERGGVSLPWNGGEEFRRVARRERWRLISWTLFGRILHRMVG